MPPPPQVPEGARLRRDVWRRHCSRLGAMTLAEKANLLHVDTSTVSRMERGSSPSGKFIVAALDITNATFDELFERVYRAAA